MRARVWRLCRLSEAPTPPLLAVGGLPENPTLSTKKKNTAGGNSKMIQGAVLLAGRVPALLAQASGLSLRASLEIGSSFGVKRHHEKTSHKGWTFLGAGKETLTPGLILGKDAL